MIIKSPSIIIESVQYLINTGWVNNIYCGVNSAWTFCYVCEKYTWQNPYSKSDNLKYVCTKCNSYSVREFQSIKVNECTCAENFMSQADCRIHGISAQLDRTQME